MRKVISLFVLVSAVFALTGCGQEDAGNTNQQPKPVADRIKEIEDNPNMPQQAKDAAIANIKAQDGGQASGMTKK
jgi:predicted small lipoprotein YifL